MKYLILPLSLLLLFTACEDKTSNLQTEEKLLKTLQEKELALQKAQKESILAQKKIHEQAELLKEKSSTLSSQAGISIHDDSITINTGKTKEFFENFSQNIEKKLRTMTKDIEQDILNKQKTGIDIDAEHINIDLNKTEEFLNGWSRKIQTFVKDFDNIVDEIK